MESKSEMNPKISVIVPVYNAGEHIKPCLDTLTQQTLQDIEIICVLDCPTDGTDKAVEAYAQQDARIKVVRNEHNLNIGESRNRGMAVATGDYIGFSDHDDYRELNMYEDLYKKAIANGASAVLSGVLGSKAAFWKGNNPNSWIDETLNNLVMRRYTTHIHPHLYKREFLKENNITFTDNNTHSVEDTLFNAKVLATIAARGCVLETIPHDYYIHVDYANNQNKSYSHWAFKKVENSIREMQELTQVYAIKPASIAEFGIRCLYTSFIREKAKNGLLATLKLFGTLKQDETVANSLKAYPAKWNRAFTLPKNIFALYIKAIL